MDEKEADPSTQDAAYPPAQGTPQDAPQGVYPAPQGAYPPPQGGTAPAADHAAAQPGQPQQTTTVVMTQPLQVVRFQDSPVRMCCPNCNNDVLSNTEHVNGNLVWIAVIFLLFFGCWGGCCLIPLCIPSLKDVHHTCPVCNYQLGKYERAKFI